MFKPAVSTISLCASILLYTGCATHKTSQLTQPDIIKNIDNSFKEAAAQYKVMMKDLPRDQFPRSYDSKTGKPITSRSDWWCSGFYPGTLFYLYEATKDQAIYNEAIRILKPLEKEQYNKTTHDLGFMMYCSFGNANRINPKPEYKNILLNSARSLATRFNPKVGCIKSWDSKPSEYFVIVDNMMNLELLFWATRETGDSSFYKIAVTHANTTMKNHFRPDYSSYHVVEYNPETGAVLKRRTAQGTANESSWARGQAWGFYGYVLMYRETKDRKYLDLANNIAKFIINHSNLPADKIPYWDFNAPGIPNALRDASAGAIMTSAFLELSKYVKNPDSKSYMAIAETMIRSLSSPPHKAPAGTNGGFIIQHSVGNMPAKSEIDVPLTYGDYYYVEALLRYRDMGR